MSAFDSLLKYIQQSEKLIIVTLTLFVAGLALYAAEDRLFDYGGLPAWARPTALIVWTICAAHVAIRLVMALWKGSKEAACFIASIPLRRRQAAYVRSYIDRLLATEGLEREMLCYALHRGENHVWVDSGSNPRWLRELKKKALLELNSADFGTAHYGIHPAAWNYMKKYPNKFINVVAWPEWPWTIKRLNEDELEKKIAAAPKQKGRTLLPARLRKVLQITWRSTPRVPPSVPR